MTSRPLWWLTYRRDGKLSVIIEAHALIDARMQASLRGLEVGVTFAEGHSLDHAASKERVPKDAVGRMLTLDKAKQVLKRLEAPRQE